MLRDELGGQLIKLTNSQYQRRDGDVVVNWGNGYCPYEFALNPRLDVTINKLTFFQRMADASQPGQWLTPAFRTNKIDARYMNFPVVCRTRVEGADGQGIVIAETPDELVDSRLYVEYIDKDKEYRVHVGRDPDGTVRILGIQRKNHTTIDGIDPRVWTGDSTTFSWATIAEVPESVRAVSLACMEAMPELHFCGLDVIYHQSSNRAYVVEANSAPMLTPRTTTMYADFVRQYAVQPEPEVELEPVPTGSTFDTPNEDAYQMVLQNLFDGHLTLRQVVEGYLRG